MNTIVAKWDTCHYKQYGYLVASCVGHLPILTTVKTVPGVSLKNNTDIYVCLFVLRFYGPVNPMGSCQARSVYLTTCLLGRLSPLSG